MGSRVSRNDIDRTSTSSTNENLSINNSNTNEQNSIDQSTKSHVYIKDQFRLDFLDCNCCCDTTKKIANCDFQGINILKDLYEMVSKLNIQKYFFDQISINHSLFYLGCNT